jgi:hypothetical protein
MAMRPALSASGFTVTQHMAWHKSPPFRGDLEGNVHPHADANVDSRNQLEKFNAECRPASPIEYVLSASSEHKKSNRSGTRALSSSGVSASSSHGPAPGGFGPASNSSKISFTIPKYSGFI